MKHPIGTNFYGWNLKEQVILGYMNFKGQEVYISNDVYDWQGNKVDYEGRVHGDILTEEEMDSWSGKRKGKMGFFGIIFSFFMVFFKNKRESTS